MKARNPMIYLAMGIAALYLLAPVLWMFMLSLMTRVEAFSVPPHWIPHAPTLTNYLAFLDPSTFEGMVGRDAIEALPRAMLNSFVVGLAVAASNVVIGSMAAYSFARLDFRGSGILMLGYLASRMVPAVGIMIPLYIVIKNMGLLNNLLALIIVESAETLPFSIWLLAGYFRTIPREIEEAARIDRCSWLQSMIKVFLPMATPCLVATGVFGFMASWGSFLYPLLFTTGLANTTMPVVVSNFASDVNIDYG